MLTLLIENCTEMALVAIVEEGHCLYMAGLPHGLHNSRYLVPKIDEGFSIIGKKPADLDLIAVGVGPGSYTGMRVGTVVAKALSYASQVSLVGVCTLEGFIPDCDGAFAAIIDARMGGAYVLKGIRSNGEISYHSQPCVLKIDALGKVLEGVDLLVCPGCQRLQAAMEEAYPERKWQWQETAPDPLHLARRAEEKWAAGEYSLDGTLELMYLRDAATS